MVIFDKEYHKNWYLKNRSKRLLQQTQRKNANTARVREIKSITPCEDCGNTFHPVCMDFDHPNKDKHKNVAQMLSYSWERIQKEIDKCELVCAN